MSGLVAAVAAAVAPEALTTSCESPGCAVSLDDAPACRVVVDFDRPELGLLGQTRADFLFVGETGEVAWVAPIELKGGRWKAESVARQLQAGADAADRWLPAEAGFRFCPVLAHRMQRFGKDRWLALRERRIRLRGQEQLPISIECGRPLTEALAQVAECDPRPSGAGESGPAPTAPDDAPAGAGPTVSGAG